LPLLASPWKPLQPPSLASASQFRAPLHHHQSMFSRCHGVRFYVVHVIKTRMTYLIATLLSATLKKTAALLTTMTCNPWYVCMMMSELQVYVCVNALIIYYMYNLKS
jgi:hypothetical protein